MSGGRTFAMALLLASAPALAAGQGVAAYAFQAPLHVVPGAMLQRLRLPAAALVHVQQADFADVRVFDAAGQGLPVALLPPRVEPAERRDVKLTPLPILGVPGALKVTGVGLRIEAGGEARVVRIDGTPTVAPATTLLGVLLDARDVHGNATGLTLDVDVPAQQPVTFSVESSPDLREWRAVAEHVAYRSPGRAHDEAIGLEGTDLGGRYLRLTWRAATPLLAPVVVRGATLTTTHAAAAALVSATVVGAKLLDAHDLRIELPFATPIAALRVIPSEINALIPVRIFGRRDVEQPWTELGAGTAYRLRRGTSVETGPAILVDAGGMRLFRVEADQRTAGFVTAPGLEVQFAARDIAVLLDGKPPYRLAAGSADARTTFLPVTTLMLGSNTAKADDLPLATATTVAALVVLSDGNTPLLSREAVLWAALLGGTLVLALFTWLIARAPARR